MHQVQVVIPSRDRRAQVSPRLEYRDSELNDWIPYPGLIQFDWVPSHGAGHATVHVEFQTKEGDRESRTLLSVPIRRE